MYNEITLEKGLYNITGKSFTEALRELDPDEGYVGTDLEGLDAYERQLKRFDIKVSGPGSDRVEKFFSTTQSAVLFPEYVRRCIKAGMDSASVLGYIVAANTRTDGVDYRGISLTESDAGGEVTVVAAGTELPYTTVTNAASAVAVSKYGRQIKAVYEVIRKQRLDLFGVILKSVGAKVSGIINNAAAKVLSDSVEPSETAAASIAYADLAGFWAKLPSRNMSAMLVSPTMLANILTLDEMGDCTGDQSGVITTPFGVKLVKCPGLADDTVIGVDGSAALEAVFASDVIVDSDKLISTQIDSIAFSVSVGFAKIYPDAVAVMKLKTA